VSYRVGGPRSSHRPSGKPARRRTGEIELWRGGATEQRAQPGDRPSGVERRQPPEIRARLGMSHGRAVEGVTIINPFR